VNYTEKANRENIIEMRAKLEEHRRWSDMQNGKIVKLDESIISLRGDLKRDIESLNKRIDSLIYLVITEGLGLIVGIILIGFDKI